MAGNKGRPGGKLGIAKTERRRAFSKTRQTHPEPVTGQEAYERRATRLHPGGGLEVFWISPGCGFWSRSEFCFRFFISAPGFPTSQDKSLN